MSRKSKAPLVVIATAVVFLGVGFYGGYEAGQTAEQDAHLDRLIQEADEMRKFQQLIEPSPSKRRYPNHYYWNTPPWTPQTPRDLNKKDDGLVKL